MRYLALQVTLEKRKEDSRTFDDALQDLEESVITEPGHSTPLGCDSFSASDSPALNTISSASQQCDPELYTGEFFFARHFGGVLLYYVKSPKS